MTRGRALATCRDSGNCRDQLVVTVPRVSRLTYGQVPRVSRLTYGQVPRVSQLTYGQVPRVSRLTYGQVPRVSQLTYGQVPRVSRLTYGHVPRVSRLTLGSHAPTVGMTQSPRHEVLESCDESTKIFFWDFMLVFWFESAVFMLEIKTCSAPNLLCHRRWSKSKPLDN